MIGYTASVISQLSPLISDSEVLLRTEFHATDNSFTQYVMGSLIIRVYAPERIKTLLLPTFSVHMTG